MPDDITATVNGGSVSTGDVKRAVEEGLGGSRYKEYEYPAYAEVVRVHVPVERWTAVYFSWMSLKGHLQGLHDFDRSEFFCTSRDDGTVLALFAVIWQGADAMAEWLENGYPTDKMLRELGIPDADISVELMRDFS
jgi:hypothetical protein